MAVQAAAAAAAAAASSQPPVALAFAAGAVRHPGRVVGTRPPAVSSSLRGQAARQGAQDGIAVATVRASVAVAALAFGIQRRQSLAPTSGKRLRTVHAAGAVADSAVAEDAAADEKSKKKIKRVTAQYLVERLFRQQGKKSFFGSNAWYESSDGGGVLKNSQERVWEHWQTRPFRQIERISEGKRCCGCTWKQMDGRKGCSFIRFDKDGKITFLREVVEPDGWRKFKSNNMESLAPLFGVMNTINGGINAFSDYLNSGDEGPLRPEFGLATPRTRRAEDVVRYLWREAFCAEELGAERASVEYSEDAVYEDLTYVEEVWPKGIKQVKKYLKETKKNAPENFRFVLDEVTDGATSCTALWHVEYAGSRTPRGVTYYELDGAGKVKYVRTSYDPIW